MSLDPVQDDASPVCQICGREGADALGGIGQVVGVAVHIDCWMTRPTSPAGGDAS